MAIKNKVKAWLFKTPAIAHGHPADNKSSTGVMEPDIRYVEPSQRQQQVIKSYEQCLKNRTSISEIRDESELPNSKREILDAISLQILLEEDSRNIEALKASAIFLADFQKGVGPKPLTLLGISDLDMLHVNMRNLGTLDDPVSTIQNNPDKEKYVALRKLADHELAYIVTRLSALTERKKQPPCPVRLNPSVGDEVALLH